MKIYFEKIKNDLGHLIDLSPLPFGSVYEVSNGYVQVVLGRAVAKLNKEDVIALTLYP